MNMQKILAQITLMLFLAMLFTGSTIYIKNGDIIQLPNKGGSLLFKSGTVTTTTTTQPGWTDTNSYTVLYEMETTNTTCILDVSGNNNSLTNKAATFAAWTITGTNQNGRIEHSFLFDGSSQYFTGTQVVNGATSYTCFAWIKPVDNGAQYKQIFGEQNQTYGVVNGLMANTTDKAYAEIGNDSSYMGISGTGTLPLGVWTFVWARWQKFGVIEIYTNNILDGTSGGYNSSIVTDTGVTIGWGHYLTRYFKGEIDFAGCFVNGANGYASTNTMAEIFLNTHPTNNIRNR